MFSQFFKQATAEKRKRAKAKELERVSRADKDALDEEKALLKGSSEDKEEKPKKKRTKVATENEEDVEKKVEKKTEKKIEKKTEKKAEKTEKKEKKEKEQEKEEEDDILADNSGAEDGKKKKKKKVKKMSSDEVAQIWKELVAGTFEDSDDEEEEEEIAPSFSPEECKIFVGGISESDEKIRAFFGKHGTIKFVVSPFFVTLHHNTDSHVNSSNRSVTLVKPKKVGAKSTAAFVEFSTPDEAKKAVEATNSTYHHGFRLRVNLVAQNKAFESMTTVDGAPARVLYIRNLAFDVDEKDLHKVFDQCGEIEQIEIPQHFDTKKPKGIAFIQFKSSDGLKKALEKDRLAIRGRVILCSASEHPTISLSVGEL